MPVDFEVAILGAGMSGIGMGIQLKQAGHDSFVILEKESALGGTWRDNTYPGCGCDVESHLYCFSFEKKLDWTRLFSRQPEILAYMHDMAERHGMDDYIRYNQEIIDARWDDTDAVWHIRTKAGETVTARIFVAAWGQLNKPLIADIPGRDDFAGDAFHSAQWNHDVDLRGKRVASIGVGASAAQYVPEIAPLAGRLDIFQRSANWIVPRYDREYSPAELNRFQNFPELFDADRDALYKEREARFLRQHTGTAEAQETERIALAHLAAQVPDLELRAKLTPDYTVGCKRIIISDDYYPAMMRDNVNLITEAIECIEAAGIRTADGTLYPADVIVWGTGFETHSFQGPVEIFGRNQLSLREAWDGTPEAYLGVTVTDFPNFFILYGPNTNLSHNCILPMIEAEIAYVMQAVETLQKARAINLKGEVMSRFNTNLQAEFEGTAWIAGCTSWYINADGHVINNWSRSVEDYKAAIAHLDPAEYELIT